MKPKRMNSKRTNFKYMAAVVALGMAAGAAAQQAKPEDEIRYRQSVMNVRIRALLPLVGMAQGKVPYNHDVVVRNVRVLDTLNPLAWDSFAPGTDKGAPTKADPKIWSEQGKFKEAADRSQQSIAKLSETVKSGDEKAIKSAVGDVGKTCSSCHDDFRLKQFRSS